ncbi:MAG: hypothetical protein CO187_08350 [Zetaproteobacteria bacterium CG_4_9_14_3_um_filter_53_7]|nr:MAG: hypothetical protein CO187_08350 [Zetaproteobacteria bacterium CG_4_9_14_3_um_filter_53_7]
MQLAEVFKALGEPVRLRLFALLADQAEICVCHLTDALQLPQSTVSRHLGVLRHAGLATTRRDGKWMHYQLAGDIPSELRLLLQNAHDTQAQLSADLQRLNSSRNC